MEERNKKEQEAIAMATAVKDAMDRMDEKKAERALGILIGLSANKELLDQLKKDSA